MANAKTGTDRPLSPHLQIYRPQLSSMPSITHRITGVANAVGLILLTWWLVAMATGAGAFDAVQWFLDSILGRIMLFGWTWALCYHFLNGIRHLVWDAGHGFEVETMERSAKMVIGGSVVLTLLVWIVVAIV
ncbi:MAG: succinate dehydrogenase, cytochrome b556 subunit [Alphaproteobacteria bacterium]|nr:succinate dehydrogenase, cytochrome b556 subunit [Alphaproteobacteria bacterium]MDX5369718.1 succinate dehydrogenase, cytochrome b556 subunit [Alphaproteobacteria bacterium]MDX5464342.1 succinate dehydrogenase, cytochrome b556 subunit [Alphaproteobacteria bacterium]